MSDERRRVAHGYRPGIRLSTNRRRGRGHTNGKVGVIHQLQTVQPFLTSDGKLGPEGRILHRLGQRARQTYDRQHAHGEDHEGADDFDQGEAARREAQNLVTSRTQRESTLEAPMTLKDTSYIVAPAAKLASPSEDAEPLKSPTPRVSKTKLSPVN